MGKGRSSRLLTVELLRCRDLFNNFSHPDNSSPTLPTFSPILTLPLPARFPLFSSLSTILSWILCQGGSDLLFLLLFPYAPQVVLPCYSCAFGERQAAIANGLALTPSSAHPFSNPGLSYLLSERKRGTAVSLFTCVSVTCISRHSPHFCDPRSVATPPPTCRQRVRRKQIAPPSDDAKRDEITTGPLTSTCPQNLSTWHTPIPPTLLSMPAS